MNAKERWESAARTVDGLYEDAWGAFREALAGLHSPSCTRQHSHSENAHRTLIGRSAKKVANC